MLQNDQDLIAELADNCDADNGVQMYFHLKQKFLGKSIAGTVTSVTSIIGASIGYDNVVSIFKSMIAENKLLSVPFPDELMVAIIITKLPPRLATVKTMLINGGTFPKPSGFISLIETNVDFDNTAIEDAGK